MISSWTITVSIRKTSNYWYSRRFEQWPHGEGVQRQGMPDETQASVAPMSRWEGDGNDGAEPFLETRGLEWQVTVYCGRMWLVTDCYCRVVHWRGTVVFSVESLTASPVLGQAAAVSTKACDASPALGTGAWALCCVLLMCRSLLGVCSLVISGTVAPWQMDSHSMSCLVTQLRCSPHTVLVFGVKAYMWWGWMFLKKTTSESHTNL